MALRRLLGVAAITTSLFVAVGTQSRANALVTLPFAPGVTPTTVGAAAVPFGTAG